MNYKNPVYPYYFADPFVWKHEGRYYAVGTGPISEKPSAGETDFTTCKINGVEMAIPLLVSNDLVNWKLHGGALVVPPTASGAVFWAPEVAYDGTRFYLYYSFATEGLHHQLRVASSAKPEGPYTEVGALLPESDDCPFAIDAHAFRDDDGQWYLFYARDFLDFDKGVHAGTALVMDRLINMTRLAGETRTVLRARCDWQRFQANRTMYGKVFDWHTLEGPCVRKQNGIYYCFYSGGCYQGEGYGVDYGTASKVTGPYSESGNEKCNSCHSELRGDLGGNFEGLSEKSVAGQNRDAFAKDLMIGWLATPEIVVIHRGEIIMNQRIGVDAFDRASQGHGSLPAAPTSFHGGEAKSGSQPFATRKNRIAHRCMNSGRLCFRLRQEMVQGGVHIRGGPLQIAAYIKWLCRIVARLNA